MVALSEKTKEDRKIEQHREQLGVVLFRKKEGFRCLGSGSVVNLVQSKHSPSCEEVICLLTSGDVVGDSSRIDDFIIDYLDSDLKSVRSLELSQVAQSTDFFRPTPGLALIPVRPGKVASVLAYCNLKSYVLDNRRTFHTEYYCNEGGRSETRNVASLRCFMVKSLGQVQLYFPTSDKTSAGANGSARGGNAVPKKDERFKLGQGEDHETRLSRNAIAHGYRIRKVNIPYDGNCLFHAVEDQLKVLGVPDHTHKSLRNLAVQELQSNMVDNHLSMDLAEFVENNDVTGYIKNMSRDGTYGGHPELVALSHAFQKTIRVVSSVTSEAENAIQDIGNYDGLPILLGHQHEYHYRSLEHAGQGPTLSASLSRNSRSVVTGRSNHLPPQYLADIPGEESGRPSQNSDVTTSTNDYSLPQKKEHLQNINFLTTLLREKYAELDRVLRQSEEEPQEVKRLKEQISELRFDLKNIQAENEGLRIDNSLLHAKYSASRAENSALRTENSALQSRVNNQNTCALCGNDSASSSESTAAKLSHSPTNCRRSESSGSSEEEYVDASSEPAGGSTLE